MATSRLGLTTPAGTDFVSSGDNAISDNATILDNAAMYSSGLASARPAANTVPSGHFYYATDTTFLYVSNGTNWIEVAPGSGAAPVGTIMDYAGASQPSDTRWVLCDGSAYSRTTYAAAFAILGTTFGSGDGSTTFNVPDFRGRVSIMAGTASGDSTATNKVRGTSGGNEKHVLATAELPSHTHGITVNSNTTGLSVNSGGSHSHTINDPGHGHSISDPGHGHSLGGNVPVETDDAWGFGNFNPAAGFAWFAYSASGTAPANTGAAASNTTGISVLSTGTGLSLNSGGSHTHTLTDGGHAHTASAASTGSDTAHNNLQPYLVVNRIIRIS